MVALIEDSILHAVNHISTKQDCYSLPFLTRECKAVKAKRNIRSNRIIGIILTYVTVASFHIPSYLLPQSHSNSIVNNLLSWERLTKYKNSTEQSSFSFSKKKLPRNLWKPVCYCADKSLPLSQLDPLHALIHFSFEIHFNIIFQYTPKFRKKYLSIQQL
jgi:hypothetical protein